MREWDFTLIVDGDLSDEMVIDKLMANGFDDATFGVADGVSYADFSREAATFFQAVISAVHDLEGVGLRVLRVEPDDLVTLAEIADRLHRSREGVRLLAAGHRGRGTFPAPISHLRARSKLWRWSDVARWAGELDSDEERAAQFCAFLNANLETRRLRRLSSEDDEAIEAATGLLEELV